MKKYEDLGSALEKAQKAYDGGKAKLPDFDTLISFNL